MKKERQDAILSLIAREEIPTQELLRERVAAMGFEVTQATLSRDIRELHLVKQRRSGKRACYTAPVIQEGTSGIFQDAVLRTDYAGHKAVIHCRSGMAQAVAVALDSVKREGVVGTIAGDDTIMCVVKTSEQAPGVVQKLGGILSRGK